MHTGSWMLVQPKAYGIYLTILMLSILTYSSTPRLALLARLDTIFHNEINPVHKYINKLMHQREREYCYLEQCNTKFCLYFVIQDTTAAIVYLFLAAAPPLCLSPSSASWRTTTSTDASSDSCFLSGPPSIWTALHSTRPWQPSSSPK